MVNQMITKEEEIFLEFLIQSLRKEFVLSNNECDNMEKHFNTLERRKTTLEKKRTLGRLSNLYEMVEDTFFYKDEGLEFAGSEDWDLKYDTFLNRIMEIIKEVIGFKEMTKIGTLSESNKELLSDRLIEMEVTDIINHLRQESKTEKEKREEIISIVKGGKIFRAINIDGIEDIFISSLDLLNGIETSKYFIYTQNLQEVFCSTKTESAFKDFLEEEFVELEVLGSIEDLIMNNLVK